LQALAAHVRRRWACAWLRHGLGGQDDDQRAVAAALGAKFNVQNPRGNLNNAFGLPLELLRLKPSTRLRSGDGMNTWRDCALARIAHPDWGVVTTLVQRTLRALPTGRPE